MESKVKLGKLSSFLTIAVTAILLYGLYSAYDTPGFLIFALLTGMLLVSALIFAPLGVELTAESLIMRHPLKKTSLPLNEIADIDLYIPTMSVIRVFGSGGYFGHWGIYRANDVGKYTAFYGKSSDCFMIRMKNGDKYVFGCENPQEMVEAANKRIR